MSFATSNRPRSIQELATTANNFQFDPQIPLKEWLRNADSLRKEGDRLKSAGDLENAFIKLARAATIVLTKLPSEHPQFHQLSSTQRQNLTLNGQEILDSLSSLKPTLNARYEKYTPREEAEPREARRSPYPTPESNPRERDRDRDRSARRQQEEEAAAARIRHQQAQDEENARRKQREEESARRRHEEEAAKRRKALQHEEERRQKEQRKIDVSPLRVPPQHHGITYVTPKSDTDFLPILPLESPNTTRVLNGDESSTDPEDNGRHSPWHQSNKQGRPVSRSNSYPPPLTTTSPPPPDLAARISIEYPRLMTPHQQAQGYHPSLQSMFASRSPSVLDTPNSLLFQPSSNSLYSNILPPPSRPAVIVSHDDDGGSHDIFVPPPPPSIPISGPGHHSMPAPYPYPIPAPSGGVPAAVPPARVATFPPPTHPAAAAAPARPPKLPVPPPPPPALLTPTKPVERSSSRSTLTEPQTPPSPGGNTLRTVNLPREVLPRFVSIAALNTARNRETCGLLLGKNKKGQFYITTLLIPRQTSTSDTCSMEEEELVFAFQDQRELLTIGWIHTHPTQSCFMSSLDLHTQCAYQTMLAEAIAVVCAPKSQPTFGIFRLTDPPGLQTISKCTAKEAFHPHPADIPIYTDSDAESGHVRMTDGPLEIVDLRS